MAKDDYDVIVYKVLLYFYGCLKRKIVFNNEAFKKTVSFDDLNESYFTSVLVMMKKEGLIEGLTYTRAWGDEYVLLNKYEDIRITPDGIHYLTENDGMKKLTRRFLETAEFITSLVKLVI